jgi:hypothetical protein
MEDKIKSSSESIIQIKKKDLKNIIKENNRLNAHIDAKNKLFDGIKNMLNCDNSENSNTEADFKNDVLGSEIKNKENKKKIIHKTGADIENNIKNLLKDDNYDMFNINKNTETEQKNVILDSETTRVQKSETSLVSSIFKKKSKSDFEKNKNMSSKYSQSPSYSEPESIKRIKNTINVTETLRGGNTISSSESKIKSNSSEESSDWSESSDITTINESSMYETLDDETVTTMTEDDKKKTYKLLNKEMNYFKTLKKVNKYDLRKYNFILSGLDILNKYKK